MSIPKIDTNTGYKATAGAVLLSAVAYYLGYRRISYLSGGCAIALAALTYANQKSTKTSPEKNGSAVKADRKGKDSVPLMNFTKPPAYIKTDWEHKETDLAKTKFPYDYFERELLKDSVPLMNFTKLPAYIKKDWEHKETDLAKTQSPYDYCESELLTDPIIKFQETDVIFVIFQMSYLFNKNTENVKFPDNLDPELSSFESNLIKNLSANRHDPIQEAAKAYFQLKGLGSKFGIANVNASFVLFMNLILMQGKQLPIAYSNEFEEAAKKSEEEFILFVQNEIEKNKSLLKQNNLII
jgi:hypothetical protein